jgi:hypothetical protein
VSADSSPIADAASRLQGRQPVQTTSPRRKAISVSFGTRARRTAPGARWPPRRPRAGSRTYFRPFHSQRSTGGTPRSAWWLGGRAHWGVRRTPDRLSVRILCAALLAAPTTATISQQPLRPNGAGHGHTSGNLVPAILQNAVHWTTRCVGGGLRFESWRADTGDWPYPRVVISATE